MKIGYLTAGKGNNPDNRIRVQSILGAMPSGVTVNKWDRSDEFDVVYVHQCYDDEAVECLLSAPSVFDVCDTPITIRQVWMMKWATVVTVPADAWVPIVRGYNKRVVVVPDCIDCDMVGEVRECKREQAVAFFGSGKTNKECAPENNVRKMRFIQVGKKKTISGAKFVRWSPKRLADVLNRCMFAYLGDPLSGKHLLKSDIRLITAAYFGCRPISAYRPAYMDLITRYGSSDRLTAYVRENRLPANSAKALLSVMESI